MLCLVHSRKQIVEWILTGLAVITLSALGDTLSPEEPTSQHRSVVNTSASVIPSAPKAKNLCGPYSVAVVCRLMGVKVDVNEIAQMAGTTEAGTTMKGLVDACYQLGLQARGMRIAMPHLRLIDRPFIAYVRGNHFMVVERVMRNQIRVIDHEKRFQMIPLDEFLEMWRGYVVVITSTQNTIVSGPNLEIEELVYDFGVIKQAANVVHTFQLKNTGSEVLDIQVVKPSCNCTVIELSDDQIRPGQTARLKMQYTSGGAWGPQAATVQIISNDPDEPITAVTLQGVVVTHIPVVPQQIEVGVIDGKSSVVRQIEIRDPGYEKLLVKKVRTSTKFIKTRIVQQKQGERAIVEVTIRGNLPRGPLNETVTLHTNDPETPEVPIPITGMVAGPIRVHPQQVFLGLVKREQPVSQQVSLVCYDKVPTWSITRIEPMKNTVVEVEQHQLHCTTSNYHR